MYGQTLLAGTCVRSAGDGVAEIVHQRLEHQNAPDVLCATAPEHRRATTSLMEAVGGESVPVWICERNQAQQERRCGVSETHDGHYE